MATLIRTLGTTTTSSLTALLASGGGSGGTTPAADVAQIADLIKNDLVNGHPIMPTAFSSMNILYVPNRGILQVLPGDYVAVDSQGWPILVSGNSIANAAWTHVP